MDLFFILIFLVMLLSFFILFQENFKIKTKHKAEVASLNDIISELLLIQSKQNGKVLLSDGLLQKIHRSRVEIDKKLLNLQDELIKKLISTNGSN